MKTLIASRDGGRSQSKGVPIFMHTYSVPVVRPSGALFATDGWLYPVMRDYEIPEADWQGVAAVMINRLADLLLSFAADQATYPGLHVFDSAREVALLPATEHSTDISGDWANEIHPSRDGYRKIASAWCQSIQGVLES